MGESGQEIEDLFPVVLFVSDSLLILPLPFSLPVSIYYLPSRNIKLRFSGDHCLKEASYYDGFHPQANTQHAAA